jgi:1-acyl-sn-glycerol-3-phosphate acyltransferase
MAKRDHEPKRVICYRDAENEDYAGTDIDTKVIGADFPFAPTGALWTALAFVAYYVIAIPIVFFYCYVVCGFRVKNRKAIRKIRKSGYFLYANHSHFTDAFLAPIVAFPKRAYVIVGPDTVSIKGLRTFVQMVGAIPIPQGLKGMASFLNAIRLRTEQKCCISVFPEAHLWNYCTFLRPLKSGSFRYPVHLGVPSVAVAVTYQQRRLRFIKQPKRTVFISDPIYPDETLSPKDAQRKLQEDVNSFLKDKLETYSVYKYFDYRKADDAENA